MCELKKGSDEMIKNETFKETFFSFEGRLNRQRYWLRILALIGITIGIMVFIVNLFGATYAMENRYESSTSINVAVVLLSVSVLIAYVAMIVSSISLLIRRLHDLDQSGWMSLLSFIPLVGFGLLIYAAFFRGTDGPNQYGPDRLRPLDNQNWTNPTNSLGQTQGFHQPNQFQPSAKGDVVKLLGKPVADAIKEKVIAQVEQRKAQGGALGFATVRVGNDPASEVYQGRLIKAANSLGFDPREVLLPENATEEDIIQALRELGDDKSIAGIMLFMPLPLGLDADRIAVSIPPEKDVDCLNPISFGQVMAGKSPWAPCTPRAVIALLDHYGYDLAGKNVVVIGRSNVVGRPLTQLLTNRNGTVTLCHSKTQDIALHTRQADLVILAAGQVGLLKGDMLKPGAWVVDVGINPSPDGAGIIGDADYGSCAMTAAAISPVPGGVGGVSVMMVMQALLRQEK